METLGDKNLPKTCFKFYCEYCDYGTCKKSSFTDHILTVKHKKAILGDKQLTKSAATSVDSKIFVCNKCEKQYTSRNGLWKHKTKGMCSNDCDKSLLFENDISLKYQEKIDYLTSVVLDIVSKNSELTKQIVELSSKSGINNSFNNNKTFNLQVFLNEECKNALNIRDFVESIQVQLSDLENTGKLGYVEGISKIFINNLNQLEKRDRPIHCSDIKREILYIKNDNEWIKETQDKTNIKNAIKQVANKNIKQIRNWQEKYPDYNDPDSKQNDKYMKIVLNSMSGSTEEEQKNNLNKIIKNLAKEVVIEK